MILTTVYQFQLLGFALSLIIIIASSIYIFIRYQEYKLRVKNNMIDQIDGINEDQNTRAQSVRMLQSEQLDSFKKKKSAGTIILYIAYAFIVILLFVMAILRFSSLCAKESFRKNLGTFPSACSSWAATSGCTYVSLYSAQCTNAGTIPQNYVSAFTNVTSAQLNKQISYCVDKHALSKLQSPKDLAS